MRINLRLFGKLREKIPGMSPDNYVAVTEMEIEDGATIADVLEKLGIRQEEVSHLFLNHDYSALNRRVRDGDRLAIFPRDMALLYRWYFRRNTGQN